ncbi:unnamed protein product [Blumeria hordei]|uniref:Uncharacterized protein n=1 Tax=Blumeria hordei TaxID=2867405 RepID=A0A383ULH5_BLUHO|nr:unnamed protein product [Blumeria hordei]
MKLYLDKNEMAPSTRSSGCINPDVNPALPAEITLRDIMTEIRKITAQQDKQSSDIAALATRMDAIDYKFNQLSISPDPQTQDHPKKPVQHGTSGFQTTAPKPDICATRDTLTIPGLQSTWDPNKGPFRAPPISPGPRTKKNLLCLSEPMVDRSDRENWSSYNNNSQYIQWLWKYWCELVTESDLDRNILDVRNSSKPFRPGLKPLSITNDVENLMHLREIQSALVQEGSYYYLWPQRVCHLFQGDFKQVNAFCKTHHPTWPMTIEAVLQILSLSNNLRSPVDAFVAFRSGPLPNESTAQFLRRFEQAFHRMPSRERIEREVECTIEYTLQTHASMVWNSLVQQNNAFPLHNALSIAWTIAEKQQNWMAQLSSRPIDREFLPMYRDPLRDPDTHPPPNSKFYA